MAVYGAQTKMIVFKKAGVQEKMVETKESKTIAEAVSLSESTPATLGYTKRFDLHFYPILPPMNQMTVLPHPGTQPLMVYGSRFGPQGERGQQAEKYNAKNADDSADIITAMGGRVEKAAEKWSCGDSTALVVRGLTYVGLGRYTEPRGEWIHNEKHPEPQKAEAYYHKYGFAFKDNAHHGWWFQKYRWIHMLITAVVITGVQDPSTNAGIMLVLKAVQLILTVGFLPHIDLISAVTEIWALLSSFVQVYM